MQKTHELTCKWCSQTFTVGSTARERRRQYCSQDCARHGKWKAQPTSRYRATRVPAGHPLATSRGRTVGVHRLVLWEKIGPGTHPCYYCGFSLSWEAARFAPEELTVDHRDRDRFNNGPDNLVPCCHGCNVKNRDLTVGDEEPWRRHAGGWRIRGNPAVCKYCGKDFVARRDHQGLYCSRGCSNRHRAVLKGPSEVPRH